MNDTLYPTYNENNMITLRRVKFLLCLFNESSVSFLSRNHHSIVTNLFIYVIEIDKSKSDLVNKEIFNRISYTQSGSQWLKSCHFSSRLGISVDLQEYPSVTRIAYVAKLFFSGFHFCISVYGPLLLKDILRSLCQLF